MISPISTLLVSAALAWLMLLVASLARTRGLTVQGLPDAFGNRDRLPEPSPFAARADRAAKNMLENLALFAVVLLAASMAGVPGTDLATPASIFVGGRLVYAPLYWAGVTHYRTLAWAVSMLGLAWIGVLAALA